MLKSPFCIHPKTGRVCVPIDPQKVDDFKPEAAPIVSDIINDLDKVKGEYQDFIGLTVLEDQSARTDGLLNLLRN